MEDFIRAYSDYLWLALAIVWLVGALTAKRTTRTQSPGSRLVQLVPEIVAGFLLFARFRWPHWLRWHFIPEDAPAPVWIGLALTAAGVAFAICARLWIGRNWSGRVTIKEGHQLIQNGPYAIVRHPIYSGILLAILGTALIHGQLLQLLALPFATFGWILKLRTEEAFMAQQFGPTYLDYKRRVKALVPFVI